MVGQVGSGVGRFQRGINDCYQAFIKLSAALGLDLRTGRGDYLHSTKKTLVTDGISSTHGAPQNPCAKEDSSFLLWM